MIYTPRSFISGHIAAPRRKELQTAAAAAAAVLGTEQIAIIHSSSQGQVWYLAAPAADLASHAGATSPLADALPGSKNHQGDGAYVADVAGGLQAIVVKNGDNLHSYVGVPDMVKRFARLEGATVKHRCAEPGLAWQLPAAPSKRRDAFLQIALTLSGILTALLASVAWLWAAQQVEQHTVASEALRQQHLKAWNEAIASQQAPATPKALLDMQKAIAQAVQEKGVLVRFEHQNGRSTWILNIDNRYVSGAAD